MSEKQQHDLDVVWHLTITLLQIYSWVRFERILKSLTIWQSYGRKVDCLKRPVVLKDEELAWDPTYRGQELL